MRLKFFITIFLALCVTALSISAIHYHFFRLERLRLIELNLQQNANLIERSNLTLTKKEFLQEGKDFIQHIIGDDKVNMIVGIYNEEGSLLYANENAVIFEMPSTLRLPFVEWEDVESKDYYIKYLAVRDEQQKRIIKVGMILNQSLIRWKDLNQRVSLYAGIILVVISLISYFLTMFLFKPLHDLATQVNVMAEKLERGEMNDFKSLFGILSSNRSNLKDEFHTLIFALDRLASKITESHNLTKKWSALMAHELKTPMTILKNSIESLLIEHPKNSKKVASVEEELDRLEKIIMDFLEWASLENDPTRPEIHVVSVGKRTESIIQSLLESYPGQTISFQNQREKDLKVFCNPIHFDQLVTNLLMNAIKYGGPKVITVEVKDFQLVVSDQGPGVPLEVLKNFGTPFNHFRQNQEKGYGLGLAWVSTIVRKYNWKIEFDTQGGTKVSINFNS